VSRRLIVVPILLLAGAATGCSTFSDNDAAARVGDFEISQDQLGDLLVGATPTTLPGSGSADDPGPSAETARNLLNIWILTRILEIDLAAQGQTVTPEAIADATGAFAAQDPDSWAQVPIELQNLQVEQQAAVATWSALEAPPPSDDELLSVYDAGTDESGVVCSAHILVATEEEAQSVLDRLEGGADFADLAASESTDTASGANGGILPCDLTGNFEGAYAPEFVEAALAAEIGEPVGPVQTEFGYHVIVLRPSDQVDPGELATLYADLSLRFRHVANGLDIYVDPRFGSFDPGRGVVAIG
jgi:parvulin-like peptidyl-prolyl cis-trans isomerase-like protein